MEPLVERMIQYVTHVWHSGEFWWVTFGFLAQAVFFLRFFVQWLVSERERRSVVPTSFWYISLVGGLMLLAYAVHKRDPVFSVGQATGVFIYLRNIIFIKGEKGKSFAYAVILVLLGVVLFMADLDREALWTSGEARNAEIAREMYETGEYVVPHLNGQVSMTKPPLYHWMTAAAYGIFGVGDFGARFASAAAAILAVLATYVLGRKMLGATAGFLAGVMTASSIEFMRNARTARTDMVYTFFTIAAFTAFYYATESKRHRRGLFVLSFALMGLAFMAKGPAGLFLPLISGIAYLYFTGGKKRLGDFPWTWGAAAFLAITAPWHLAATLSVDAETSRTFYWEQLAHWSTGGAKGYGTFAVMLSFLLYVPYLAAGFFPWSFLLPAGIWAAWKGARAKDDKQLVLALAWFGTGLAAFSLSGTKAARYMIPMFPAAALMAAYLWREAFAGAGEAGAGPAALRWLKRSLWPLVIASVVVSAAVAKAPAVEKAILKAGFLSNVNTMDRFMVGVWTSFFGGHPTLSAVVALVFAASALGAVAATYRGRLSAAFGLLAVVVTGYLCLYQFAVVPKIDGVYNVRPFVEKLERVSNGERYGWVGEALLESLYYMRRPYDRVAADGVRTYLEENPKAVVLVWRKDLAKLPEADREWARGIVEEHVKHREVVVFGSPDRPRDEAADGKPES